MKHPSATVRIAILSALVFIAAFGHSLLFQAQLTSAGPVCFTLGLQNVQRTSMNNLALPVAVKVMAGSTQLYNQTVNSDATGKVTVDLPVSVATSHTVTLTPKGHMPVTFTVTGDLSGTCIAVPGAARAGDVNEDGAITTADLVSLIQAMRGVPTATVTQTYGIPTMKLLHVVEAIRNMRMPDPGVLTVARGGVAASSSSSVASAVASSANSNVASSAMVVGELGPYPSIRLPDYGGHPVIPNLTSINPKIVVSRIAGMTPFMIQVHAAETTATFTDGGAAFKAQVGRAFDPYLDLEYRWDFGDAGGAETLQHPVTGQTVNMNSNQTGPEAAYVYRNPGNYTVRLTVRGWNGSSFVTASTTTVQVPEVQQFRIDNATGGNYTLSLNGETTAPLAYNATPADVAAAVAALPSVGAGNVHKTDYGMYLEFIGTLFGQKINQITMDGAGLTGTSPKVMFRTTQEGATSSSVTAQAWSGQDKYFDPTYNGSNGASDGTIDRPYTTGSQFTSWVSTANHRAYVKRGTTLNVGTFGGMGAGVRVDSYGTGPLPVLESKWTMSNRYGSPDVEDVVVANVRIHNTSDNPLFLFASSNGDRTQWYNSFRHWSFIDSSIEGPAAVQLASATQDNGAFWTFWRTDFKRDATTVQSGQGLLIGLTRGLAIVGGSFSGGDGSLTFDHHIYPTIFAHSQYRWIDFRLSKALNFCINTNARYDGVNTTHVLIDGNDITGTQNGWDASNSHNSQSEGRFDLFIVQNNAVHIGQVGNQGIGWFNTGILRGVARDNHFWNNPQSDYSFGDNQTHMSLYRNAHFSDTIFLSVLQTVGFMASNTYRAATSTNTRTLITGAFANLSGWKIDRNTYFAPAQVSGGQPKPFLDSTTSTRKSFTEWQSTGFDANGQYADPHWKDPANGDFSAQ